MERERIASGLGSMAVGSVGGLPFEVGQHAAAATPIARATLARLRADVRGAVEARRWRRGGNSTATTKDRFVHAHLRHLTPADAAAVTQEAIKASRAAWAARRRRSRRRAWARGDGQGERR